MISHVIVKLIGPACSVTTRLENAMRTQFISSAMAVFLMTVGQASAADEQWGEPTKGLQMSVSVIKPAKAGDVKFQVAIRNVSEQDVILNLGIMLANGKFHLPDRIRLNQTDAAGKTRELHFSDKRFPGVAGRVDDYLVPLRAGSVYSLTFRLEDFWSPDDKDFAVKFKPGKNQIVAHFEGIADDTETEIIPVWKGKLKSNVLNLEQ